MLDEFEKYLLQEGKAKNTIKSYMLHVGNYFKWFRDSFGEDPLKLYRQNVLEYKSYLEKIKKENGNTINAKLAALTKFNDFLIYKNIQSESVLSKKDNIKIQMSYASPATITKQDVEVFRQRILQNECNRSYAVVTVLSYAGLRISECLNLKIDDVNLVSKELIVREGKGSKQRIVYINTKIVDAIKEYLKERKKVACEYMFVSNKGNRLDRTVVNKLFNKYSDKITPHTLRHFYCSNALESGFSVHEVANQAGHSNIHTTLLYTNPSKEELKRKTELL